MSEIKRYSPEGGYSHELSYGYMEEDGDGEYVKWEDYRELLRAVVKMAIPYEAIRMDGGSRKWIAPEVWDAIVVATEQARSLVKDVVRTNPEEGA